MFEREADTAEPVEKQPSNQADRGKGKEEATVAPSPCEAEQMFASSSLPSFILKGGADLAQHYIKDGKGTLQKFTDARHETWKNGLEGSEKRLAELHGPSRHPRTYAITLPPSIKPSTYLTIRKLEEQSLPSSRIPDENNFMKPAPYTSCGSKRGLTGLLWLRLLWQRKRSCSCSLLVTISYPLVSKRSCT